MSRLPNHYQPIHARIVKDWHMARLMGRRLEIRFPGKPEMERIVKKRIAEIERRTASSCLAD